ncbi:MAG TPA: molybdate ABC transporter substrate-binding protein [Actinopolymorphaceae bacterium]
MKGTPRRVLIMATVLTLACLAACGTDRSNEPDAAARSGQASGKAAIEGTVTVFAAASLTEAFTTIGEEFEAAHPGVTVRLSFAGSSALATQIVNGAPADVFASAAPQNMQTVTEAGLAAGRPTTFVSNQLVIAVPRGNPKGITGLADLTKPGVKVALCAAQVPCGAAARRSIDAAGLDIRPVTLEPDVKGALTKVRLNEVDAALVYRTDVRAAASDVDGIEFFESAQARNDYPIVVLKEAPNPAAAAAFVSYVLSARGRDVLADTGFQLPRDK